MENNPKKLAKLGHFDALKDLWQKGDPFDLAMVFERAVTDFKSVKRNAGHLKTLKFCVDEGLELTSSTVGLAAKFGNTAIVDYMVEKGLPFVPFVMACMGNLKGLKEFGETQPLSDVRDSEGFNLLHACASSGLGRNDSARRKSLTETCQYLIEQGVSSSLVVEKELPMSPAYGCAAFGGNVDIMNLLLDQGEIDVSAMHLEVEFALEPHQRTGEPFYDIAKTILDHGFDLNSIRPNQGRTLLHGCANRGTRKAVAWLLEHGADPNSLDDQSRTTLHVAAQRNTHTGVIQMLVDAGANVDLQDELGKTALDTAKAHHRHKVITFLKNDFKYR